MKTINELDLGYPDAENYKKRENKEFFNKIFFKDEHLERLTTSDISFLIGEKGTGKTAYSVFLANQNYKNNYCSVNYIRETEYQKFITMKAERHLNLSNFTSIWKVILYLLLSQNIIDTETNIITKISNFKKFRAIKETIDEYYYKAFSPEIIQALNFVDESKQVAEIAAKFLKVQGEEKESMSFSESRFQSNLFYLEKKFEEALKQLKLDHNHIIFIDGIDIRPDGVDFQTYLECIKGLATAIWQVNNDIFPSIKDSRGRLRVVMLLRPDIFASLGLQNQNTKLRSNSVLLDWRTEYKNYRTSSLFKTIDNMLSVQQEENLEIGKAWDFYFPWDAKNLRDNYNSPTTSFVSFLRWSYYRPRDIIVMIEILKTNAKDDNKTFFDITDFENLKFKSQYSEYLLGEVKDQLLFYYSNEEYENFLKFFEFLEGKSKFKYDEFVKAFEFFELHISSISTEKPRFMATPNDFLQFLYDLNVICYIEYTEDCDSLIRWCFRERNYANIAPKVKTHKEYQIFYGLTGALNLGKKLN